MGVKRLWNVLKLFKRPYAYLIPQRRSVMIDAFNVIYAYAQNYTNENFHIAALYRVASKLMRNGLVPIFVFDNASTFLKRYTQLDRQMARGHIIHDDEVDFKSDGAAQFYEFYEERAPQTFRDEVLTFENKLSDIVGLRKQEASRSWSTSRLPSYRAYTKTYRLVVDAEDEPQFDLLMQELTRFSEFQMNRIIGQHASRASVDFYTQRLQVQFNGEQSREIVYDVAYQFGVAAAAPEGQFAPEYPFAAANLLDTQRPPDVRHSFVLEPIKIKSKNVAYTELGDEVQNILDALNIPVNRTEIERSLVSFSAAMGSIYRQNKASLREQFDFTPKLTTRKIEQCRDLLNAMSLPHFTAAVGIEAEQLAASFTRDALADFVFSKDADSLVFGAKILLSFDQDSLFCVTREDMNAAGITRHALIYLAMLLGGDFHHGLRGVGEVAALEFLAAFGPISNSRQLIAALDKTELFVLTGKLDSKHFDAKLQSARTKAIQGREPAQAAAEFYKKDALALYLNETALETQIFKGLTESRAQDSLLVINKKFLQFCAGYCDSSEHLQQLLIGFGVELQEQLSESVHHVLEREAQNYQDIRYQMRQKQVFKPDLQMASRRVREAIAAIQEFAQ